MKEQLFYHYFNGHDFKTTALNIEAKENNIYFYEHYNNDGNSRLESIMEGNLDKLQVISYNSGQFYIISKSEDSEKALNIILNAIEKYKEDQINYYYKAIKAYTELCDGYINKIQQYINKDDIEYS